MNGGVVFRAPGNFQALAEAMSRSGLSRVVERAAVLSPVWFWMDAACCTAAAICLRSEKGDSR